MPAEVETGAQLGAGGGVEGDGLGGPLEGEGGVGTGVAVKVGSRAVVAFEPWVALARACIWGGGEGEGEGEGERGTRLRVSVKAMV